MNTNPQTSRNLLLAAVLSASFATCVLAQPPQVINNPNETYQNLQVKLREKKFSDVLAEAQRVLQTPELAPAEKVRFLNLLADAHLRQTPSDYSAAIAAYEKITADTMLPASARIAAVKNVSDVYVLTLSGQNLDEMNLAPAYITLDRALKFSELKPEERAAALRNIAVLAEREDNFSLARQAYQQILELEVNARTRNQTQQLLADSYAAEGDEATAQAMYRQYNLDPILLYSRLRDIKRTTQEIIRVLDDAAAPDATRWSAFSRLPGLSWVTSDNVDIRDTLDDVYALGQKYLPALLETDPNRARVLLQRFKRVPIATSDMRQALFAHPDFLLWSAPLLLKINNLSDADYTLIRSKYLSALAVRRREAKAFSEARALAVDTKVPAATRLWAQLVAQAKTPAALPPTLQSFKTVPEKDKADALMNAAHEMLRLGDEAAARRFEAAYNSLFQVPPRAAINCPFTPNAPFDVSGWLASPLLKNAANKGKMERPYGDNLQVLLDTDAAVTGRQASAATKESTGDTETDFYVTSDEHGLHFFLYAYDARIQEVVSGLANGGSFEMYLAPGAHQAYYTFLPRLPDGRLATGTGSFITMYPNAQFRLPSVEAGTLRTEARTTDKGTAMYFSFAWELFYDKLPANGDKWQFESIRWTRSGGRSFGGSESVHNRSTWGDIVFSGLTPDRLNAIKRGIIYKAVAKYRVAKTVTEPVGNWADSELGDPEFFRTQVAPLLATLDQYAERVKKDMSATEVETLFRDAVPGWMEIQYRVQALRTQYLHKQQLAGAP